MLGVTGSAGTAWPWAGPMIWIPSQCHLSVIGMFYSKPKQIRDYYFDEFTCRHTFLTVDTIRANVMLRAACVVDNTSSVLAILGYANYKNITIAHLALWKLAYLLSLNPICRFLQTKYPEISMSNGDCLLHPDVVEGCLCFDGHDDVMTYLNDDEVIYYICRALWVTLNSLDSFYCLEPHQATSYLMFGHKFMESVELLVSLNALALASCRRALADLSEQYAIVSGYIDCH